MYYVQIQNFFCQYFDILFVIGLWHRGTEATVWELIVKWLCWIYHALFVLSLVMGAIRSENGDDAIVLIQIAIIVSVLSFRFVVLICKQKRILSLLERIGCFSIKCDRDATAFNEEIDTFMKFVRLFMVAFAAALFFEVAVAPFLNTENILFFKIAFPLDWKHNRMSFWIANIFIFTEVAVGLAPILFTVTLWYLMLICSLRYKVLGWEMTSMGRTNEGARVVVSKEAIYKLFSKDLKSYIDKHLRLRELVDEAGDFFSTIFCAQFGTSSIIICGSVYCLAFNVTENLVERVVHSYLLLYNICELFMIAYFGNEIMLSSDRLTYSLFESDWIDQPYGTRKNVIIFGEYLKQSHQLFVAKLYPLTLVTFTAILRSAYSMFNILKTMKE